MYQSENVCIDSYFFDLKEETTAFSRFLMDKQAEYVTYKVAQIVKEKGYSEINFITHSLGSFIANLAMQQSMFPINQLKNVFCLASPYAEAP